VDSEPGRGSAFTVELPFSHPGEAERMSNQEEVSGKEPFVSAGAFNGKRIMVVEDSPINLEIALELLKITGAELSTALDGEEAVEKFKASPEHYYDLLLMDLQMPNLDGYQATEMIRSLERTDSQTVPIVAMTANAFDDDVVKCLTSGMNAHISKPLDLPIFYSVIRKYL
ncbi:MAG: response regulator, partial [bacterium]